MGVHPAGPDAEADPGPEPEPGENREGVVDPLGCVRDVGCVGQILGQPLARGIRQRDVHHLAAPLGMGVQQLLEGKHPPHDVLGGLHAVRSRHDAPATRLGAQRLGRCHRRRGGRLVLQRVGVGAEWCDERRRRLLAHSGVTAGEVRLPGVGVEPTGAVAGHAVAQLGCHVVG